MKKLIAVICLIAMLCAVFTACDNQNEKNPPAETNTATPQPTEVPEKVTEKTDYVTERWVAVEIEFNASETVRDFNDAVLDVTFTNRKTGTSLTMPGFWDGGTAWKVRFAPTEYGIWDYETKTSGETDIGINGIKGTLASNPYTGDLEIYKRGFIQVKEDCRYFVYADGTPFFYLGDTHWTMPLESLDSAGDRAENIQTDSHFKYIVDRRVAQGFTVYQSQPLQHKYDINDGRISSADIRGFQEMDQYFKYIAEKGLVHANAELGFPSLVGNEGFRNNVSALTRYWVARYGAYPVMWTLGQEVDNGSNYNEPLIVVTYLQMMNEIVKCDPYKSPLSAHQINAASVTAKGGVATTINDFGPNVIDPNATGTFRVTVGSSFCNAPGYSWWASQWRPTVDRQYNFNIPKDYWENGKNLPIVDYEARYHLYAIGDFGARAQAWIAYLCGMGHGYGATDMWYYKSNYQLGDDAFDGIETIPAKTREETTWADLVDAPIATELRYIRGFMEAVGWWKLTPDFDYGNAFKANQGTTGFYACAHTDDEVYVVYLYARNTDSTGKLVNMDSKATYSAQWFDTRTGRYTLIDENIKPVDGQYVIPLKPIADDMVLLVTKN